MKLRNIICTFIILLLFIQFFTSSVSSCKDIIACGDATADDTNLLLKVRDPSRPGYQVLHIIPKGYQYQYPQPWTGISKQYTVNHTYIGVTSKGDIPPAIFKPGMCLTDAGISYGDADSLSGWVNPSKYAWDDFDWIRYSAEQADSTDEAVYYLTEKAVDQLHAPGVSENLFVVGPEKGYVIEADALRYHIKPITNGVDAMSNYPRELWNTQWKNTRLIAPSFDTEKKQTIRAGGTIRLNSVYGIRIKQINDQNITAVQVPFFSDVIYRNGRIKLFTPPITIEAGQRMNIGDFSVTLLEINKGKATIHIQPQAHAWHQTMMDIINSAYGSITVKIMMNWSRLQRQDLDGLRGMCQPGFQYEGVAIYSIPSEHYTMLSGGWFSANHACASIYVPFHICNTEVFDPYGNGDAAALCHNLSEQYGTTLLPIIKDIEDVFLTETDIIEEWAKNNLTDPIQIETMMTNSDVSMQEQAWLMQRSFKEISTISEDKQSHILQMISSMWRQNYEQTLPEMKNTLLQLSQISETEEVCYLIEQTALTIGQFYIMQCYAIGKDTLHAETRYQKAMELVSNQSYQRGFDHLEESIDICQKIITEKQDKTTITTNHVFIPYII